ncbi:MAG: hypothetical protein K0U93_23905 [Gammaproteobacteria bacterium]|nr:hypothetical protein [Gammaproteobacteria bacterium]
MLKNLFVLVCAAILAGCATSEPTWVTVPLASVESPKRVYISQSPEYRPPRFAQGTPFFLLSSLMDMHGDAEDGKRFSAFIRENNLDIEGLALDVFSEELRANGPFDSVVDGGGDGQVQLVIADYGLERGWSFTRSKPLLRLEARLFDVNGKMLWEDIADVTGYSEVAAARSLDEWMNDPDGLRSAFEAAMRKASRELVKNMHQYRG